MDNLGRDVERAMWALVLGGVLAGMAVGAAIVYVLQRLKGA